MSFDRAHARLTMSPLWKWAQGKHIEGLSCITAHSLEILPLAQTGKPIFDDTATKFLPHAVELSIQENDKPKQELFAESERDFFSKVADDALTFETDSQGHVIRMVLHTGGRDIPINRID